MPFSWKKVKPKLVEGNFEIDDQILRVTVNANAITGKTMDDINEEMAKRVKVVTGMEQEAAQIHALAMMLAKVIKSWSATDGEPTEEFLIEQPVGLLTDLLQFCMELVNPKAKTAGA